MKNQQNDLLIAENLVLLDLQAATAQEALSKLANNAFENGIVKASFRQALLDREVEFPTGLQGSSIGVAIPHTDAEHVNEQAVSVGILEHPVEFIHMGTDDQMVSVDIIIMLAIKKPESQLEVLQNLIGLIQHEDVLKQMKNSQSARIVVELLEKELTKEEV